MHDSVRIMNGGRRKGPLDIHLLFPEVGKQIANRQIFMINPQIADPHIFTKYCPPLSQYSRKSRYLKQFFLLRTNMNLNIFFYNCAHCGLVCCNL
jgi:hypothetical protein